MELTTTADFATDSSSVVKATASSAADGLDTSVIAGVIAAVVITVLVVLALIAVYLYKHKGSYRTHEMIEEGEADKALQGKTVDPSEEKQEYFM
ncbi:PREDICTED: small cell adhesion glycoprotein homolog [Nanorana parkeri]|uniref:small cell adhesion glycoprotein homolog n=1 Tax=Nanorana parkeri TaxID=125878 RepID=UPI000854142B|nr:PREDICTED: small cell adhesion glycoprotein homolog [Nanorana parkeri]